MGDPHVFVSMKGLNQRLLWDKETYHEVAGECVDPRVIEEGSMDVGYEAEVLGGPEVVDLVAEEEMEETRRRLVKEQDDAFAVGQKMDMVKRMVNDRDVSRSIQRVQDVIDRKELRAEMLESGLTASAFMKKQKEGVFTHEVMNLTRALEVLHNPGDYEVEQIQKAASLVNNKAPAPPSFAHPSQPAKRRRQR